MLRLPQMGKSSCFVVVALRQQEPIDRWLF